MKARSVNATLATIDPEDLCEYDPLLRMLLKLSKRSGYRAGFIAFTLYLVLDVLAGWLISEHYASQGYSLLKITHPGELFISIFVYLIAAPTAWIFYVREPIRAIEIFRGLNNNGVIGKSKSNYLTIDDFVREEFKAFNRLTSSLLTVLLTLVVALFAILQSFYPFKAPAWFNVNPYFFWGVWIPLVHINSYIIFCLILRRSITIRIVNRLFGSFDITPLIYHRDKANGLFPIGNYAIKVAPLITVAGFWLIVTSASSYLHGDSPELIKINTETVLYVFIYLMATVIALIPPILRTHRYMRARKEDELARVGKQIVELLGHVNLNAIQQSQTIRQEGISQQQGFIKFIKESVIDRVIGRQVQEQLHVHNKDIEISRTIELINALEKKYQLIEENQHSWPLNVRALQRYTLTVISPILSLIISVIGSVLATKLSQ